MHDPWDRDEEPLDRHAADDRVAPAITRLQWLKLASGGIALGLIAAIRINWHQG